MTGPAVPAAPAWLDQLARALPGVTAEQLTRFPPPPQGGRHSAVLALFGESSGEPDLLLTERAHTLRSHAGQPAFPGGALDPDDGPPTGSGPVRAALREAQEEVGVQPASVHVLGTLPTLWLPPSGFHVHPVLAHWRVPHPVGVVDAAEVAAVVRVPIAELAAPENRLRVTHPSGWTGPAFEAEHLLVWGFTAMLIDRLLELGGWARPWDEQRLRQLDERTLALAARTSARPSSSPSTTGWV